MGDLGMKINGNIKSPIRKGRTRAWQPEPWDEDQWKQGDEHKKPHKKRENE